VNKATAKADTVMKRSIATVIPAGVVKSQRRKTDRIIGWPDGPKPSCRPTAFPLTTLPIRLFILRSKARLDS
jgi:hypothetical protein